jgi:hypothetical protein
VTDGKPFDGILSYLQRKHEVDIYTAGIVVPNTEYWDDWGSWDFRKKRVQTTHYSTHYSVDYSIKGQMSDRHHGMWSLLGHSGSVRADQRPN